MLISNTIHLPSAVNTEFSTTIRPLVNRMIEPPTTRISARGVDENLPVMPVCPYHIFIFKTLSFLQQNYRKT